MSVNTLQKNQNSLNISVEVALFKEDEIWVAYCPALEVSSYGDDKKEAKEAFEEAMQIFLAETQRKGTLEKYLLKLGWQLQQKPRPVYNQPHFSIEDNKRLLEKNPLIYNEKVTIPVA
jgi:predicted RNase H-like HicB family nuclease